MFNSFLPAVLVWSIVLAAMSFATGQRIQANADKAARVEAADIDAENVRLKNRAALAAGLRTEQAQARTDTTFQKIKADYLYCVINF